MTIESATTTLSPTVLAVPGALCRASIGKKAVMAVTGLVLFGFTVGHLAGNLLVYRGAEALDAYARWLHEHGPLLWGARVVLLACVLAHTLAAVRLTLEKRAARPVGYAERRPQASSLATRTMMWSGPAIFLYVIYHLLHFTVGTVHPDFVEGSVYHNVVAGFRQIPAAAVYIAAMIGLGFHLQHGVWSAFQTLGLNGPRVDRPLRCLSCLVGWGMALGYVSIPVAVLAGWVAE